jgi:hypothetical protein
MYFVLPPYQIPNSDKLHCNGPRPFLPTLCPAIHHSYLMVLVSTVILGSGSQRGSRPYFSMWRFYMPYIVLSGLNSEATQHLTQMTYKACIQKVPVSNLDQTISCPNGFVSSASQLKSTTIKCIPTVYVHVQNCSLSRRTPKRPVVNLIELPDNKTPAKWSAYRIPSVIVVFVITVLKV